MESKAQVRKTVRAALVTLFISILQQAVFAGVAVSPVTQHIEVKPGKKATFSITVSNNNRGPETIATPVRIDILDFVVSDTGALSFGPQFKHPRTAAGWIILDANQITLNPGESRTIKGTVTAPLDADGDYWASAMVSLGKPKEDVKGVQVKLQTATGLFIRVARRTHSERGTITDVNIVMPTFETGPLKKVLSETDRYRINEKQSLKISAKLTNEGLISIKAKAKAFIYNDKMKKVASVPLYVSRNNVLPGDSRWFGGIMSQPLPAGTYKLRIVFSSEDSKRQLTRDAELNISGDLADTWAKNTGAENGLSKLEFAPEKIDLNLNAGRNTTSSFQIKNAGLNTIAANCKLENSEHDWVELKTTDFTLSPNGTTSMPCSIKIPADAKSGVYKWTAVIEMEEFGLEDSANKRAIQYNVPITITIN